MQKLSFVLFMLMQVAMVAHAADSGAQTPLTLVGKGIREKKAMLFINVSVYEAGFFVDDKAKFTAALSKGSLEALREMNRAEIQLKFLRTVSSAKIRESFLDALKSNKVDVNSANMKAFLEKIGEIDSYEDGKSATITGDFTKNTLTYLSPQGKATEMKVAKQDIVDIYSIWLGTPADSGLEALKEKLLGRAI